MAEVDLSLLRVLVAVMDHRSMGAAARALDMAQPNVSRAVARAERMWRLRLLNRSPTGSRPTPEGRAVAERARRVLAEYDAFTTEIEKLRLDWTQHVKVAASVTVAEYLAPTWLSRLRDSHPGLELQLFVCNSAEVMRRTRRGVVDVGFVESPDPAEGLQETVVARDRLEVVVAPHHPWGQRTEPLTAADLVATPLVMREDGSGTRRTLLAALAPLVPVPPAMELSSNAAVLGAVRAGVGPAVLSALAVADEVERGNLVRVPVLGGVLDRDLRAVWRAGLDTDGAAWHLVELAAYAHRATPFSPDRTPRARPADPWPGGPRSR